MQLYVSKAFEILKKELIKKEVFFASKLSPEKEAFVAIEKSVEGKKDTWYREIYVTFHWEAPSPSKQKENRNIDHYLGLKHIQVFRWYTKDFLSDYSSYIKILTDMGLKSKTKGIKERAFEKNTRNKKPKSRYKKYTSNKPPFDI